MSIANPLSNPSRELESGKALSNLSWKPSGTRPALAPSRGLGSGNPLFNPGQELGSGKALSKLSRRLRGTPPYRSEPTTGKVFL